MCCAGRAQAWATSVSKQMDFPTPLHTTHHGRHFPALQVEEAFSSLLQKYSIRDTNDSNVVTTTTSITDRIASFEWAHVISRSAHLDDSIALLDSREWIIPTVVPEARRQPTGLHSVLVTTANSPAHVVSSYPNSAPSAPPPHLPR